MFLELPKLLQLFLTLSEVNNRGNLRMEVVGNF